MVTPGGSVLFCVVEVPYRPLAVMKKEERAKEGHEKNWSGGPSEARSHASPAAEKHPLSALSAIHFSFCHHFSCHEQAVQLTMLLSEEELEAMLGWEAGAQLRAVRRPVLPIAAEGAALLSVVREGGGL